MITEITTGKEELELDIKIIVRKDIYGIQIDNPITPIYCCNCDKQLDNFYKMYGGRYGYVGFIDCNCGAQIHCVDSDNIVEYLKTGTYLNDTVVGDYYIDFKKLYKLNSYYFEKIRDTFNFDIFTKYCNQTVSLKSVINELEKDYNIPIYNNKTFSNDKFYKLPTLINRWLFILSMTEK